MHGRNRLGESGGQGGRRLPLFTRRNVAGQLSSPVVLLWLPGPQSYITFLQESAGLSGILLTADIRPLGVPPPVLALPPPLVCLIC